jgi:hypothetical protein
MMIDLGKTRVLKGQMRQPLHGKRTRVASLLTELGSDCQLFAPICSTTRNRALPLIIRS